MNPGEKKDDFRSFSNIEKLVFGVQFIGGRVWNGVVVSISLDGDGRLTANLSIVSSPCNVTNIL